jgi:hypothetical protein
MAEKKLTCAVCDAEMEKDKRCGTCNKVNYCSKKCQDEDYPSHKRFCRPRQFGILPAASKGMIEVVEDEYESILVAARDIDMGETVLIDDPIFFQTSFDFASLPDEEKNALVGDTKSKFFWVNDPMFAGIEEQSDRCLKLACEKALWLCLEKGTRINWHSIAMNPRRRHHKTFKLTQSILETLCKSIMNINPRDVYHTGVLVAPAMTSVYSRGTFFSIGNGLFLNSWRLTHNCNPNCNAYLARGKLYVVSTRQITKGETMSVGYHPLIQLRPYDKRRQMLRDLYGVEECICSRCIQESAQDSPIYPPADEDLVSKVENVLQSLKVKEDAAELTQAFEGIMEDTKEIRSNFFLHYLLQLGVSAYILDFVISFNDAGEGSAEEKAQVLSKKTEQMDKLLHMMQITSKGVKHDERVQYAMSTIMWDHQFHNLLYYIRSDYVLALQKIASGDTSQKFEDPEQEQNHIEYLHAIRVMRKSMSKFIPESVVSLETVLLDISSNDWKNISSYYFGP